MVIQSIIRGIAKLYPFRLKQRADIYCKLLYASWIGGRIGHVGNGTMMERPCILQGGGHKRISIGDRCILCHHCVIGTWIRFGQNHYNPEIAIGNDCSIGEYCHITAINKITIGDGLLTGRFVYIGDNSHGGLSWEQSDVPPAQRPLQTKGEIIIGRNVWIGDRVSILGGVTIGDNVIIGAGSVVTSNIPSNCVAAGTPAKIMKSLSND